ncbi:MAG TPA: peptide deformylase [Bryobacteraceae bacterium]|jgi:peptide deformylase|nr:peptide deformylase [Bryobacteraceae bacterium]
MILKIYQAGCDILRQECRPLTADEIIGAPIQQLIEWMRETMRDAPGVGLAAPQVGVAVQLAVIEDRPENLRDLNPRQLAEREREPAPFQVIVNPRIWLDGPTAEFFEGCLSVAGFTAIVPRARRVTVECLNERAEPVKIDAVGWYARILQHEIDHLHGRLYVDRMLSRSFMTMENYTRRWKDAPIEEVKRALAIQD